MPDKSEFWFPSTSKLGARIPSSYEALLNKSGLRAKERKRDTNE
jgi:hypothetical protein